VLENAGADAWPGVLERHEVDGQRPGQFVKLRTGAERCGIRCEPFGRQIDVRVFVKSAFG
jgi:hypothetical protein